MLKFIGLVIFYLIGLVMAVALMGLTFRVWSHFEQAWAGAACVLIIITIAVALAGWPVLLGKAFTEGNSDD